MQRTLDHDPTPRWTTKRHRRVLSAALATVALSLAATAAQARDDDDGEAEPRDHSYCSATARLLFTACGYEAKDDHFVLKAKCINYADAGERTQCLAEARQARAEAGRLCREQLDWRGAACRVLGERRYDPPFKPDRFDSDFRQLSNRIRTFRSASAIGGCSSAASSATSSRSPTRPS